MSQDRIQKMLAYFDGLIAEDIKRVNKYLKHHIKNTNAPFASVFDPKLDDLVSIQKMIEVVYDNSQKSKEHLKTKQLKSGSESFVEYDLMPVYPDDFVPVNEGEVFEIFEHFLKDFSDEGLKLFRTLKDKKLIDLNADGNYSIKQDDDKYLNINVMNDGSINTAVCLAHEFGHAYHNYIIEDKEWGFAYCE